MPEQSAPARLYVRFAETGNIRKWQVEPFEEGVEYICAETADAVVEDTEARLAECVAENLRLRAQLAAKGTEIARLRAIEAAALNLRQHIRNAVYRDATQLRLADGVPAVDDLDGALTP